MAKLGPLFCCMSKEESQAFRRSKTIDRILAKDKQRNRRTVKLLLLGSGESGKSTFLKQMRIINCGTYTDDELMRFKPIIYNNIMKGMKVLIDARDKMRIPWGNEHNIEHANRVFGYDHTMNMDEIIFLQYVNSLQILWEDNAIRSTFSRRNQFQLGDSVRYFLDNLHRIGQKNYVPLTLDTLHSRKATKGIAEHEFLINDVPFLFVDVGGQRSQRQKWFQCFEGVTSILFLTASNEYDQVLMEDRLTNRLVESCNIFDIVINNKAFASVSVILFLNKRDLLEEKIKEVNIKKYFHSFEGNPRRLEDVQKFELNLFDMKRRDRSKALYHHFTTAIDTENIRFVFRAVRETILQNNLRALMLQ